MRFCLLHNKHDVIFVRAGMRRPTPCMEICLKLLRSGYCAASLARCSVGTMPSAARCRKVLVPVLAIVLAMVLAGILPLAAAQGETGARMPSVATVPPVREIQVEDTLGQRLTACTACHGKQGRAGSDGFYPRIAGKPAGYLYNQLLNFRQGRRQYPLMIYLVEHQTDAYLHEIAVYFSDQHPPYAALQPVLAAPAVLARGRVLAQDGDVAKKIPACIACHGKSLTGVVPSIPGLLGLPRDYVSAQFGAWRTGARRAAAPDCMAQITQRLSVDDISAVSAWLAAQPVAADGVPQAAAAGKLPLACGSFPQ